MLVKLYKLALSHPKKWAVILTGPNPKTIYFGARGYEDYTIHHDEKRKKLYITRHKSNKNWNNPRTSGFWSRWLLWNRLTINLSIKDIKKRFNIVVIQSQR